MRVRCHWLLALVLICLPAWAGEDPSQPPDLAEIGPKPNPVVPPTAEEVQRSIDRGIEFLLKRQNDDGSWGSANISRPQEVYAPVPGCIRRSVPR